VQRETVGVPCPKDGGEIVVKKSRRGKVFYGCANYPKCDVVFWDKPVLETCPKCSTPFLLEKTTKKDGTVRYCQNEDCDYKIPVDNASAASETDRDRAVPA
jgi:DNA topoisomerase-1